MALERTFSIIKPDATRRNITGQVAARLEEGGLRMLPKSASTCHANKLKVFTQFIANAHSLMIWSHL